MKSTLLLFLLTILISISSCNKSKTVITAELKPLTEQREFYQLKIYTFDTDDQVQVTDDYLENAYLPGLKKLGIDKVGIFKPRPEIEDTIQRTYVLVPFTSLEQMLHLEENLLKDESYLALGRDYINASYDMPPYRRIESVILRAFVDMPSMQIPKLESPRANRIYELRSYESPTESYYRNKVDMFNAGGEVKLFDRLEFNAVFYGEVISGSKMPNLMYMTTFNDQESRDEHWKAFGESPEWKELIAMPKYENNVSHADILLLYPADYSNY